MVPLHQEQIREVRRKYWQEQGMIQKVVGSGPISVKKGKKSTDRKA